MPGVVFAEESKTGLCFEIRQRQQKCWRKPKVQLLANPAVDNSRLLEPISGTQNQSEEHGKPVQLPEVLWQYHVHRRQK